MAFITLRKTIFVLPLLLAGCGLFSEPERRPCPGVMRVDEASRIVQYRKGPGRDLIDVVSEAELSNIGLSCKYKGNYIEINLRLEYQAKRGPAAKSLNATFPYFVVIVNGKKEILAKKIVLSEVTFNKFRRRAGVYEELTQRIPLAADETGADYAIIVGFQLSRDQLRFNRRQLRR